jgi:light-regulated signal transduction histidine kinase (bacteriophytochrome)
MSACGAPDDPGAKPLDAGGGSDEVGALRRQLTASRAALDELEALQRSLSHELRSPIGAVLNFATVLAEDYGEKLDAAGLSFFARIRRSAEFAVALLEGLERFARAGRGPLQLARCEAEPIVRDAFDEALSSAGGRAELSMRGLPAVMADPGLLRQVFVELLGNAIKFSGGDAPRVAVEGRVEPDGGVVFAVIDAGAGFEMRFAHRLFRPFERLHSREARAGAGVGLAVVRRIVERHGGWVRAEGEPGRGARFSFSLPPPGYILEQSEPRAAGAIRGETRER